MAKVSWRLCAPTRQTVAMTTRWTMLRQVAISCALLLCAVAGAARTRPHYGGTLRVETAGDPLARPDGVARRLVFDGLTTIASDGSPHAALATSWTSEDGFHRWQFRLRPGVRFHDGSALTSSAVATSLTGSCGSGCPWGGRRKHLGHFHQRIADAQPRRAAREAT